MIAQLNDLLCGGGIGGGPPRTQRAADVRSYRRQRTRLLMWSALCFVGLAANNILMFIDLVLVPDIDLSIVLSGTALAAVVLLLIGLLWEDS